MKTDPVLRFSAVALACSLLVFTGCSTAPVVAPIPAPHSASYEQGELQSGRSITESQNLAANCFQGEPKLKYDPPGVERKLSRPGYALLFSGYLRVPLWVSEHHQGSDFKGPAVRREDLKDVPSSKVFIVDTDVGDGESPTNKDYAGSGFDRGHQAAAAMFKFSQDRTNETYYYTNMAPQVGEKFNRGVWAALEGESRELIKAAGEGWVITGAVFYDKKEDTASTATGVIDVKWIGKPARVAVPTHFYKIVVTRNAGGEIHCYAFLLANKEDGQSNRASSYDWSKYQTTVSEIERLTKIDFMPSLSPVDRLRLETKVDPIRN